MKTFRMVQLNALFRDQVSRVALLGEALLASGADFITLQEVTAFQELREVLGEVYPHRVESHFLNKGGQEEGVAIFSRTPLENPFPPTTDPLGVRIGGGTTTLQGLELNIFSAHFIWGSAREPERLSQAEILEERAAFLEETRPGSVTLLGGDLNALPQARSLRYLTGLDLDSRGRGTLWTDAWATVGDKTSEITNDHSTNLLGQGTARDAGVLLPELLPPRRIDYLMTRGWAYGKPGGPLSLKLLESPSGEELSDHQGLVGDFLLSA